MASLFDQAVQFENLALLGLGYTLLTDAVDKDDHVRLYPLCAACLKKIWVSGAGAEVAHETTSMVV